MMSLKLLFVFIVFFSFFSSCKNQNEEKELKLLRYFLSGCEKGSDPDRLMTRIVSKETEGDTTFLTIGFAANCCFNLKPSIKLSDDTLYVKVIEKNGERCTCDCCFEITLVMIGLKDTSFVTKLENEVIFTSIEKYYTVPVQFEMFKGDTINLVNKYGQRQGWWLEFDSITQKITRKDFFDGEVSPMIRDDIGIAGEIYYPDGKVMSVWRNDTTWEYDRLGTLKERVIEKDYLKTTEKFYQNGKLKLRCQKFHIDQDSVSWFVDTCYKYDIMGKLISKYAD